MKKVEIRRLSLNENLDKDLFMYGTYIEDEQAKKMIVMDLDGKLK